MAATADDDAVAQELLQARERIKELEDLVESRENKLKEMGKGLHGGGRRLFEAWP